VVFLVSIVPHFGWVFNAKYPLGGGHGFSSKNQPICCFVFVKLLLHTFLLMCASGKIVVSSVLRLVLSVSVCGCADFKLSCMLLSLGATCAVVLTLP